MDEIKIRPTLLKCDGEILFEEMDEIVESFAGKPTISGIAFDEVRAIDLARPVGNVGVASTGRRHHRPEVFGQAGCCRGGAIAIDADELPQDAKAQGTTGA
jgi:hypothetical protein